MTALPRTRMDMDKPPRCRRCGEAMRLYGVESHPTIKDAALRTYMCERCDGVQAVPASRRRRNGAVSKTAAMPSLLANKAFDDEITSRLGMAYEAAWRKLNASGSPLAGAASTGEQLARCILEWAAAARRMPIVSPRRHWSVWQASMVLVPDPPSFSAAYIFLTASAG